jgi:4-hydroxy-tetrahydrodipicolinate reductase
MPDTPLRLLIHGASGRMGGALLRLAAAAPDLRVVAAVSRAGDVGAAAALRADVLADAPEFDVAVDFSLPDALAPLLALCEARGRALVTGTTGLDAAAQARLRDAATHVPVVWASNFSLGVVVLESLVARVAAVLTDWRVDVVETHHVHKKDAPSGTALTLARAAAGGRGLPPIESIREGEVVGDHVVRFLGPGETLHLAHHAGDRDIFAAGALEAARRLVQRPPGWHALPDLLGLASP